MNGRHPRTPASSPASRTQGALIHRGPGAIAASHSLAAPFVHAPNAALLIDFDNVTMGIRSDLGKELRTLLSSDIIKGKVAVQRAYADWRRYPQYIVPLSEASIDLIFAPAYGSSKKNATDIRLAIDALELVFTRPEIGTFILLSGDSDFSSLVIKLKEYGKYVIGVGIRESSSDLLVQNCDEYYSYNALAGLVKASEEEPARKFDPYELVSEAITRMKRNGDVMRSDRLKQVMQDIDPAFDEKNLGMSKFSRFVQQAHERGLLSVTKLENGQLEVGPPATTTIPEVRAALTPLEPVEIERPSAPSDGVVQREAAEPTEEREERGRRGRRGRGRGRGREREERGRTASATPPAGADLPAPLRLAEEPVTPTADVIGANGERLTRNEAFDLVRRAVETLTTDDEDTTRASAVRQRAREILGRDSESLNERMFIRILKDAHDSGVIDLRRRGDDFEVARAVEALPVADQVARADAAAATPRPALGATAPRLGMGPRGAGGRARGRLDGPPPELLAVGVVDEPAAPRETEGSASPLVEHSAPAPEPVEPRAAEAETASGTEEQPQRGGRKRGGRRTPAASMEVVAAAPAEAPTPTPAPAARKSRARTAAKTAHRRARTKKAPKTEN
ncbi:MAG TPA: NYN domain-containing protein [Gemmatimonadaceae bacterium]|nr:NYN domain-containing protein [Gemmatimonadaceae bacterium]